MNPWKAQLLDLLRNVARFAIWLALVANVAMACVFAIVFTAHFLQHAWGWCARVLFSEPW